MDRMLSWLILLLLCGISGWQVYILVHKQHVGEIDSDGTLSSVNQRSLWYKLILKVLILRSHKRRIRVDRDACLNDTGAKGKSVLYTSGMLFKDQLNDIIGFYSGPTTGSARSKLYT